MHVCVCVCALERFSGSVFVEKKIQTEFVVVSLNGFVALSMQVNKNICHLYALFTV